MTALTLQQKELLERHYDGELSEFEAKKAEKLIASSATAREFVESLEEIGTATRAAEEQAWSTANAPEASSVAATAIDSDLTTASLDELAPLLERFFDGETDDLESEFVASLIDSRDDVADYLTTLDNLRGGILGSAEAMPEVDFGGFWDAVSEKIDEATTSFDSDEHRVLLYRFHDGEVTDEEVAQVNGWVDANVPEVVSTLDALREVKLATTCGIETAQEGVDFSSIWAAVEDAMDEDLEAQGDNIVAFGKAKRENETKKQPILQRYQQSIYGAVAALFIGGIIIGLFNDQIFEPKVIEKTVVIVDSVEYAPGSSVMINSPVQQASAIQQDGAEPPAEEPTVIWILDTGEENLDGDGSLEEGAESEPADAAAEEAPADVEPDFGNSI